MFLACRSEHFPQSSMFAVQLDRNPKIYYSKHILAWLLIARKASRRRTIGVRKDFFCSVRCSVSLIHLTQVLKLWSASTSTWRKEVNTALKDFDAEAHTTRQLVLKDSAIVHDAAANGRRRGWRTRKPPRPASGTARWKLNPKAGKWNEL